jgi:stage III sporulation protein AB
VCLIFAGAAAGCLQARKLRERRDQLRAFLKFLSEAKTEIAFAAVPVDEILERYGRCLHFLAPYFYARESGKEFTQAWKAAADSRTLSPRDRTLLRDFGNGFGATDMQGQQAHCSLYEEMTRKELEDAEEDYRKKGRLYRMLGVCAGAMLALVLI